MYHSIENVHPWTQSMLETQAWQEGFNYDTHWSNASLNTKQYRLNDISAWYTSCDNSNDLLNSETNMHPTYIEIDSEMIKKCCAW